MFFLTNLPVFAADTISYSTHVENIGWQNYVSNGQEAGTTGKALQVEALKCKVNNNNDSISYNTHVENIGWMTPVRNDQVSGTTGRHLQVECINMVLEGSIAERNDLYYQVHVQDIGWMGWSKNGDPAGTIGGNKQVEAIKIVLVPKGGKAPGSTDNSYIDFNETKASGALSVSGNKLVNQYGKQVQLRGVSTHGLAWYPQYVNQQLFNELGSQWKANTVRLAMYTAEYNGYCSGGNQAELKSLVKKGIDYATNAGLYVIVDWHILSDGNPNTYKDQAKSFFNEISSQYRNNTNIIYEICNEPNGGTTWQQIKSYAQEVIPVIKANDSDAVIIVGTPNWSQQVNLAQQDPITGYSNIMYALHFYAGTHKDDLRNTMISAYNAGLPIFVSEFGITDASGNGNLDTSSANQWIEALNSRGISYICWSLSNKNESSALINSSCNKISGFGTNDLSGQGQWLLNVLNSPGLIPGTNQPEQPSQPNNPSQPEQPSQPNQPSQGKGDVVYELKQTNSWTSGDTYYQFELTVKNNTQNAVSNWSKKINFSQNITVENSWNGNFTVNGKTLTISGVDFNKTINPGDFASVGFIVKSGSGLTYSIAN